MIAQNAVRRLRANGLALALSNGGGAALAFLLSALIGRSLGAQELGLYAATLAWIYPLSLLAEAGLGTLLAQRVAQDAAQAQAYLIGSARLRLLLGGGLTLALLVGAPLLSSDERLALGLRLSAPLVFIQSLYASFSGVWRGLEIMRPLAWLNLSMLSAQVVLVALALSLGGDVLLALALNTLTSAGQLVAAYVVHRRRYGPIRTAQTIPGMAALLRQSASYAVAAVLAALSSRLAFVLLESLAGLEAVGLYSAAWRWWEAARLLPFAYYDALFPRLSSLAQDQLALQTTFRGAARLLALYGLLVTLVLASLSNVLLRLSFGTDFVPAAVLLSTLAWGAPLSYLKSLRTLYWYALGQAAWVNRLTLLVLALYGVALLLVVSSEEALGAAWAFVLTEGLACAALWLYRPLVARPS
ncbi:MAG: oligosaccharide flippase family protein [Anaerolineae bacterium]|nr:oligosaccharide flippase family protein [Anaerolineae bacterium]MDW8171520.1 oligosaccharide flippase family protein [Anaerolineae bacterium]